MSKKATKANRKAKKQAKPKGAVLQDSSPDTDPQYEWVIVGEERGNDGRPHTPRHLVASLDHVRYDPSKHTNLDLLIRTGAGPQGEIIGQYKVYPISKLHMRGTKTWGYCYCGPASFATT